MQSIQKLRKELKFNVELAELLNILKGVADSEFRKLEKRKERFSRFIDAFAGFFEAMDFSSVEHPFSKGGKKLGLIMVTSDEGFMGGLNNRVINTALSCAGSDDAMLIVVGNWGAGYLRSLGRKFSAFAGISSEKWYKAAIELKDFIIKGSLAGSFNKLMLVYPKPVSFTIQKVEVLTILPCSELFTKYDKLPAAGRQKYIIESSLDSIIEHLLSEWVTHKLFEVFEDSKLSEFSARTVHLEESYQILLRRGKSLKQQYFRSYHEFIDRGMRETFSAQIIRKRVSSRQ